jgi:hypothetical protein
VESKLLERLQFGTQLCGGAAWMGCSWRTAALVVAGLPKKAGDPDALAGGANIEEAWVYLLSKGFFCVKEWTNCGYSSSPTTARLVRSCELAMMLVCSSIGACILFLYYVA